MSPPGERGGPRSYSPGAAALPFSSSVARLQLDERVDDSIRPRVAQLFGIEPVTCDADARDSGRMRRLDVTGRVADDDCCAGCDRFPENERSPSQRDPEHLGSV